MSTCPIQIVLCTKVAEACWVGGLSHTRYSLTNHHMYIVDDFFISDTKCCQNANFDWKIFILLDWLSSWHKWQGYTHQMPNLPSSSSSYQSEMCMNVEQVKLDRKKLDKFEWKPIVKYEESETVYSVDIHGIHLFIWGLWRQKQISQKRISNSIPQYSVWGNYLSLPEIPASGTKVLI